ncbi:MAG: Ig-like domain-containing protein [Myxococcales bacterium]
MRYDATPILAFALACAACAPSFNLPPETKIHCDTDADCPTDDLRCQVSVNLCVLREDLDITPPTLVNASAPSATQVLLVFNEPMGEAAGNVDHYAITGSDGGVLKALGAIVSANGLTVTLFTEPQVPGERYTVTITNVADAADNPLPTTGTPPGNVVTFDAYGESDPLPPDLIAPLETVLAQRLAITLLWANRAGAEDYTVQVATDPEFQNLVIDFNNGSQETSVTLPDASRELPALDQPITYFWRVRANVTTAPFGDDYPKGRFDVIDDAVYVYCPGTTMDCTEADAVGSRTRPFTHIQSGVGAAIVHGVKTVRVAARGDDKGYAELVALADGIGLVGGFGTDFATSDPVLHETIIENDALSVVTASSLAEASIDGFTIRGSGKELPVDYGVDVSDVVRFTMRRCKVLPRSTNERAVGLNINNSGDHTLGGGVLVEDCEIAAGRAGSYAIGHSNGVRLSDSSATFRHNVISSATVTPQVTSPMGEFHSSALRQANSRLILDRNTITSGPSASVACASDTLSCASWAVFASGGEMELTSNVIVAGASENTNGVLITDQGRAVYVNNTIAVDVSGKKSSALNQDGQAPTIVNNLFIALGTPTTVHTSIQDVRGGFTCQSNVFVNYLCSYSEPPYGAQECQTPEAAAIPPVQCTAANGNVMLSTASAALPGLASRDFKPGPGTDATILGGGQKTTRAATDLDGSARTCGGAGACWSVGAFEVDPVP